MTAAASVVVCTFNREALLADTLQALIRQRAPDGGFEILVVDNNSTDETRAVTERVAAHAPVPVRYLFEPQQGLSFARNAGIGAATGSVIAFIDDDVDVGPEWLSALVEPFADSSVGCTGGPIRPKWPLDRPAWITSDWEGYLGITEFEAARVTGEFTGPVYPWGGNIAFRRVVFESVGLFPTDLGRIGTVLLSSEEIEVCRKIEEAGWRIRFAPNAVIYHKIPQDRITKTTFYHRTYHQGRSDAILDLHTGRNTYSKLRQFAASLFWLREGSEPETFDRRCRERIAMGYASQLIGLHDAAASGSSRRRSFMTFVRGLLGTSRAAVAEARLDVTRLEALVHERDTWLAKRDSAIAERDASLAQVRQTVLERQAALDGLNSSYGVLEREREAWKKTADDRQATADQWEASYRELGDDRDAWKKAADDRQATADSWEASFRELQTDRDGWQRLADERQATVDTLAPAVESLKESYAQLAVDRDNWRAVATEREQRVVAMEADRQQLTADRDGWQRVALERQAALDAVMVEQHALAQDRDQWQKLAAEREAALWQRSEAIDQLHAERDEARRRAAASDEAFTKLHQSAWTRLGRRLSFITRGGR